MPPVMNSGHAVPNKQTRTAIQTFGLTQIRKKTTIILFPKDVHKPKRK